jgi:hypothetical protein
VKLKKIQDSETEAISELEDTHFTENERLKNEQVTNTVIIFFYTRSILMIA